MNGPIDHSNYEAWLLDRLEGNLTPEQERQLEAFLAANPGLDPGPDELPTFDAGDVGLTALDKDALKRELPPTGMPHDPIGDFLIAHGEGDLSPQQEEALQRFVNERPELHRDADLYRLARIAPVTASFSDRESLYRQLPPTGMPTPHGLDDLLVAWLEGDLDAEQERAVADLVQHDAQAAVAWQLVQHTRVNAGVAQYPDKEGLKKGGKVIVIGAARASWAVHLRVAATVAVLLGMGWWGLQRDPGVAPQLLTGTEPAGRQIDGRTVEAEQVGRRTGVHADGQKVLQQGPRPNEGTLAAMEPSPRQDLGSVADREGSIVREAAHTRLTRRTALPALPAPARSPLHATLPEEMPMFALEPGAREQVTEADADGIPLMAFLAGKLRKRVLDTEDIDLRPLDTDDAVAAVDLGLRSVAGDKAGLDVRRNEAGRISGIDMRLGRNLAITAGR